MQVTVRDNNVDQALRALKKKLQREGVFREMKLRRSYEKPSEKRAREKAEAVRRHRKLLMRKREIARLSGSLKRDGITLIPLEVYFNEKGRAKLALGLAKGKKQVDKRDTIKARDWQRDKARLMREKG